MPKAPLLNALAQIVRELRTDQGLTQEALGDLHRNYVGGVERAQINPTITQLERLATALGTTPSDLLAQAEQRAKGQGEG